MKVQGAKSILFLGLLFSLSASAHYGGECTRGYRHDAYGRGIEAGFKNIDATPKYNDIECYNLGLQKGRSLRYAVQVWNCEGDFEDGYEEGFKVSPLSAGSECYSGGYTAGRAALTSGAREENRSLVGNECVDQYLQGYQDNIERRLGSRPIGEPEATCYAAGNWDGNSLPRY